MSVSNNELCKLLVRDFHLFLTYLLFTLVQSYALITNITFSTPMTNQGHPNITHSGQITPESRGHIYWELMVVSESREDLNPTRKWANNKDGHNELSYIYKSTPTLHLSCRHSWKHSWVSLPNEIQPMLSSQCLCPSSSQFPPSDPYRAICIAPLTTSLNSRYYE